MAFYSVCSVKFDSNERFPELTPLKGPPERGQQFNLRRVLHLPDLGNVVRAAVSWTTPTGTEHLCASKTERGYILRFVGLAEFFIESEGRQILYRVFPHTPPDTVRHLFLDGVIPLLLSLEGWAVLHASAVQTPYGAVAFLGRSGTGKSTLASAFQHLGYEIISDDCLVLEQEEGVFKGKPSYPGVRLKHDSLSHFGADDVPTLSVAHYNSKRRLNVGPFTDRPVPIGAIYCLTRATPSRVESSPTTISPILGHRRFTEVLRYLFCLDPQDRQTLVKQFKILQALVGSIPVYELQVPDGFQYLQRTCERVLAHVADPQHPQLFGSSVS